MDEAKKNNWYDTCYICGSVKTVFARTCGSKECKKKDLEDIRKTRKSKKNGQGD